MDTIPEEELALLDHGSVKRAAIVWTHMNLGEMLGFYEAASASGAEISNGKHAYCVAGVREATEEEAQRGQVGLFVLLDRAATADPRDVLRGWYYLNE